jgi:anaerobic selenocysteine-containing dehydrogenase
VIDPPLGADVIEEWEFFYGLGQRMGLSLSVAGVPLDMKQAPTTEDIYTLLCRRGRIPLSEVQIYPHGHIFNDPTIKVKPKDEGWTYKMDVGAKVMIEELALVAAEAFSDNAREPEGRSFPYRLISRRLHEIYNSSGRDIPALVRKRRYNPAFMHPDDMERLGVETGDIVEISSTHSSILGVVETDSSLRIGVISMAHAFGDAPEYDSDVRKLGGNTGRLIDSCGASDRFSRIPLMSAIPVNVEKATLIAMRENDG